MCSRSIDAMPDITHVPGLVLAVASLVCMPHGGVNRLVVARHPSKIAVLGASSNSLLGMTRAVKT